MGLLRVFAFLFVVLLALSLALRVWLRLRERGRLAEAWEATDMTRSRATFVREGMAHYERSLLPKLLWGVIVVPMAALAILLYLLNTS